MGLWDAAEDQVWQCLVEICLNEVKLEGRDPAVLGLRGDGDLFGSRLV